MKVGMTAQVVTIFLMLLGAAGSPASESVTDTSRGQLHDLGVDVSLDYLSESATNVRGGDKQLWRYADQWAFGATLDLERIVNLSHATFQITVTDRNGRSLSRDAHLSTLLEVQEIYGRGQTWRWTQFAYDQKYLNGMLDWKIGRLVGGEDFAGFSCAFLNLTFCGQASGNIAGAYWYTWPVSQWATRLKVAVSSSIYFEVGAFESNPRYLEPRNGLNLGEPGGAEGTMVPIEVGWTPVYSDSSSGSYKLGIWYNSSKAVAVVDAASVHRGHSGAYLDLLHTVDAFSFFLNVAVGDRNTSTVDKQITAGVFHMGPLASRPRDEVGFAVGRTHVNNRIDAATSGLPAWEDVTELYYDVHVAARFDLRPSVQFVHWHDSPTRNANTLVYGVRLSSSL
jgi:porin